MTGRLQPARPDRDVGAAPRPPSPRRFTDIDRAKGVGIFLVVLGHIVARDLPADNEWFEVLKGIVYRFHMPFFMFVSGLIAAHTYRPIASARDYAVHVRRRAARLLPAYLLFGALVFAAKWAAQLVMHVDNPVGHPVRFLDMFIAPMQSHSAFLWFIWVLFLLYCLVSLLLRLTRERLAPLLAVAFVLQFVSPTRFLGIDLVCEYLFVFLLGFAAMRHYPRYVGALDAGLPFVLVPFAGALIALLLGVDLPKWLVGLSSIPAIHALVRTDAAARHGRVLEILGRYTFPIYLMNTLAIGLVKALILLATPWDGARFLVVAPALLLAGLVLPLLVKQHLRRRVPWLDRITT